MKKTIILLMTGVLAFLCFSAVFADGGFSDLPQSHWAYGVVSDFVQKGIISGFEDGTFKPDDSVTTAQLAKLIALSAKLEIKKDRESGFADVTAGDWYYPYITACDGLFTGEQRFPDGLLMLYPDTSASRLTAVVAVVKALKLDISNADISVLKDFKDLGDLSQADTKYIALALSKGIINGYPDGTFNPNGRLTRAEVTAVLARAFKE